MENFLIMLGLFILGCSVCGVVGVLVYFLLKPMQETLQYYSSMFTKKRLKIMVLTLIIFCAGYLAVTAVYPSDDFYFGEFETITSRKIPDSAKVLTKSATYPDLHGDYDSEATIQLSSTDYQSLFKQIQQDKRFNKVSNDANKIQFLRMIENREDRLYYIDFYSDGKTIGIYLINY